MGQYNLDFVFKIESSSPPLKRRMRIVPRHPFRPNCKRCGGHMIATTPLLQGKRAFECLRCHRPETCEVAL